MASSSSSIPQINFEAVPVVAVARPSKKRLAPTAGDNGFKTAAAVVDNENVSPANGLPPVAKKKAAPAAVPPGVILKTAVHPAVVKAAPPVAAAKRKKAVAVRREVPPVATAVLVAPTIKKKRRARSGNKALREIKKYQKDGDLLIPKSPFQRLIREIADTISEENPGASFRFQVSAIDALQEASEVFLTELFTNSLLLPMNRNQVKLEARDVRLTLHLQHPDGRFAKDKIDDAKKPNYIPPPPPAAKAIPTATKKKVPKQPPPPPIVPTSPQLVPDMTD